jgi:small subunit ribosomal protein S15
MSVTKTRKTELIREYARGEGDTGSPEVQVAVLTQRVNALTEHMQTHPKDHSCRRGLLMLVSRRRRLLDYIRRSDSRRYIDLIARLGIRK